MTYTPKEYWELRGKNYRGAETEEELEYLYTTILSIQPQNVLEVGSGYGRVFRFLNAKGICPDYEMCDIAESFIRKCKEYTHKPVKEWDGVTLPYPDNSFELVISYSVLLHVEKDKIIKFVEEHKRVSSRYIYVATWHDDSYNGPKENVHCIHHDYFQIFESIGLEIVKMIPYHTNRKNFLLMKKEGKV